MLQKSENHIKADLVKAQALSVISIMPSNTIINSLVFGTRPENKCSDIIAQKSSELSSLIPYIQNLRPGEFGKTPLSKSLKIWGDSLKNEAPDLTLVLTDGADQCGQDPCKTLKEIDKKISNLEKKFRLSIVGFDLKSEKKDLQCLKELSLKSIDLSFLEADQAWQMNAAISEALEQVAERKNKNLQKQKSDLANNRTSPGVENLSTTNTSSAASNKNSDDTSEAHISISGAEPTDNFTIRHNDISNKILKWPGGLFRSLQPGEYEITYENPNGTTIKLTLSASENKELYLGDFLKKKTELIQLDSKHLGFVLTPKGKTLKIYREVKAKKISPMLGRDFAKIELEFGDWELLVESPDWLKNRVETTTIKVNLNQNSVALDTMFLNQLNWIKAPTPDKNQVLEIRSQEQTWTRLIPIGVLEVPVKKTDSVNWKQ